MDKNTAELVERGDAAALVARGDLVDRPEAQDIINISKQTFYRYITSGRLSPAVKILIGGGKVLHLYRRADVMAIAEERAGKVHRGRKRQPQRKEEPRSAYLTTLFTGDRFISEEDLDEAEQRRREYVARLEADIEALDIPQEDKDYIKRALSLNKERPPRKQTEEIYEDLKEALAESQK